LRCREVKELLRDDARTAWFPKSAARICKIHHGGTLVSSRILSDGIQIDAFENDAPDYRVIWHTDGVLLTVIGGLGNKAKGF
jgi:hypothetical protein